MSDPLLLAKITELLAAGIKHVDALLIALLSPTAIDGEETVERGSFAAEKALQDLVVGGLGVPGVTVPGLMSKANWVGYANNSTLEDQVTTRLDKRFADAATRDAKLDVLLYEREIRAAEAKVQKRGGEAYAKATATQTRRQPTRTYGPSWWESNFPGENPPPPHRIRQILKELNP